MKLHISETLPRCQSHGIEAWTKWPPCCRQHFQIFKKKKKFSLYEGTHSMKVTIYAPPFQPPFFRSLENLYSFDPYILAKMWKMSYFDPYILAKIRKMSYFDPYFSSKLGKIYISTPPFFFTLLAFRVDGRWGASLSETWPICMHTVHVLKTWHNYHKG